VYAIWQCARENNRRAVVDRQIHILSDSQAALRAISSQKVTSRLVWDCIEELKTLAERNNVRLTWVPGHQGIEGNEKADELAKRGSESAQPEPGQILGIPKTVVRGSVKGWIREQHKNYWAEVPRQTHGKTFIREPCAKRTAELLSLSRDQLRIITGFMTGHAPVKEHLSKLKLYNGDLTCRLCGKETETVKHILCTCETLDRKRQSLFGQPQGDPELYSKHPAKNLYKLVQGTKVTEWVV